MSALSFPRTAALRCGVAPRDAIPVSLFSLFQRIHARNRQCEYKLLRTVVGKQFRDADKKKLDPLEIISAASRATSFADRISADSHRSFFLIILGRSFFPGPFFFLFLRRFYVVNRPRTYLSPLPVPPTPPPCSAFYGPRTGPIFLPRQPPFLPSPLPLLREPTAVLFLIYIFAVRSHLRSFASPPPPRSSLLLSIFLNLLRSETTCLSHGKISIVRRDIARTEMSCRRCRELASSFDRYTWYIIITIVTLSLSHRTLLRPEIISLSCVCLELSLQFRFFFLEWWRMCEIYLVRDSIYFNNATRNIALFIIC